MKIKESSIVYIFCTYGIATGGVELLHQLGDVLNNHGIKSFIVYVDQAFSIVDKPLMEQYNGYNVSSANSYIEDEDNAFVFYESAFYHSKKIKHGQIIFWWLSVDNFFHGGLNYLNIFDILRFDLKLGVKIFLARLSILFKSRQNFFKNNIDLKWLANQDILHCYQSEYAQQFLLSKGVYYLSPLSDYINLSNTVDESDVKLNEVLYNPAKGFKQTKRLMDLDNTISWFPLKGLTRQQMDAKLRQSKVYVDFGIHPGKDRIPREAALSGCVIITGNNGSAAYFEDIPISKKYKFHLKDISERKQVLSLIKNVFDDYDVYRDDFENYCKAIKREKEDFINEVLAIFK